MTFPRTTKKVFFANIVQTYPLQTQWSQFCTFGHKSGTQMSKWFQRLNSQWSSRSGNVLILFCVRFPVLTFLLLRLLWYWTLPSIMALSPFISAPDISFLLLAMANFKQSFFLWQINDISLKDNYWDPENSLDFRIPTKIWGYALHRVTSDED